MKKRLIALAVVSSLMLIRSITAEAEEEIEKEILFRDIPWGTSYTDVDNQHGDFGLWALNGDGFITPSVDAVLLDDQYEGIHFEYGDINILGHTLGFEPQVAGYTASEVTLYFVYTVNDGKLNKTEQESALYGANYKFETIDLESMSNDFISKLTSLYGHSDETTEDKDIWGNVYTFTHWSGANDTELTLKTTDASEDSTGFYSDEISISYAWRKGDELLQAASDVLKSEAKGAEAENYGNSNTDGL